MMNFSDDWYTAIKSKIETYPHATHATNATKRENVANVANVARVEPEKSLCTEPLFIDGNGNALRCTKCSYARTKYVPEAERERPYVWRGLCLLDPNNMLDIVGTDSRCALVTGEDYASVMQ